METSFGKSGNSRRFPFQQLDDEATMIEDIATSISNKLNVATPSRVFDGFIGMEDHMRKIEPLLRLDLEEEVRMIGIWGPPGIGKSAIARCLFNQHSGIFPLRAIMVDIRGSYQRPCLDEGSAQLQLQSQMLTQMLNHNKDIVIHHLDVAQERLKNKKVFLVLDDVDQSAQLVALAKETRWFGHGSRIIITTENLRVLKAHGINHIYKVDFPTNDQAFQMFCMYAFDQKYPKDGFEDLAQEVTYLAGKLPLGLKVLGSHFRGMSMEKWEMALPNLQSSLEGDIEHILRFSYDALCEDDKFMFLHIACFFNKVETEKVVEHLKKTFPDVRHRLDVLAEKSLIEMCYPFISMHEMLEKLGRNIVRNKCIHDPGQRQFLVHNGEIRDVLTDDEAGSRSVIGIYYTGFGQDEVHLSEKTIKRMSNLQFLKLDGFMQTWHLSHGLSYLSSQLRLLDWSQFPLACLPSNFDPRFLVELNMPSSKLEKLWEGNKLLPNLKWMDLSNSDNLKELPNLSTATKLQKLDLDFCSNLVELPSSIGHATNLQTLHLSRCSSLVELPSSIGNIMIHGDCSYPCLEESCESSLDLEGYSSLAQIPSFVGNATHLKSLCFDGCSSLVEVPAFIGNLNKLSSITMSGCSKLEVLPVNVNLKSLDYLDLSGCSSLKSFPEISTNVSFLNLSGTVIEELPPLVKGFSRLRRLKLSGCKDLVSLPQLPDSLEELDAENCESLERLDFSFRDSCIHLNFGNCFKLNKEARDLIIQRSNHNVKILPGKEIPTCFTHQDNGSSLIVELNEGPSPSSVIFKACILLVKNDDTEDEDSDSDSDSDEENVVEDKKMRLYYRIKSDEEHSRRRPFAYRLYRPLAEHLYIIEFEKAVATWNEIFFELWHNRNGWVIKECGVHIKKVCKEEKNEGESVDEEEENGESVPS